MLDLRQRTIIRDYLDSGMTPESVANYLGRVADLEPDEVAALRRAAEEILNEIPAPALSGKPRLSLIKGERVIAPSQGRIAAASR
jgi:hypothetical protein